MSKKKNKNKFKGNRNEVLSSKYGKIIHNIEKGKNLKEKIEVAKKLNDIKDELREQFAIGITIIKYILTSNICILMDDNIYLFHNIKNFDASIDEVIVLYEQLESTKFFSINRKDFYKCLKKLLDIIKENINNNNVELATSLAFSINMVLSRILSTLRNYKSVLLENNKEIYSFEPIDEMFALLTADISAYMLVEGVVEEDFLNEISVDYNIVKEEVDNLKEMTLDYMKSLV